MWSGGTPLCVSWLWCGGLLVPSWSCFSLPVNYLGGTRSGRQACVGFEVPRTDPFAAQMGRLCCSGIADGLQA